MMICSCVSWVLSGIVIASLGERELPAVIFPDFNMSVVRHILFTLPLGVVG